MKIEDYINLPYTVELNPYPDGRFHAAIKELPGCMTEGESREEALSMIEDAKIAWIETAIECNKKIPVPL